MGLAALIVAFYVIRVAAIEAFAAKDPVKAGAFWPGHPAVVMESGLAEVGETAAAGRPVDRALVDRLIAASAKAPLAIEPFLVRGVEAQLSGDEAAALRSFLAARLRNPRAIAPRYFLANHYLDANQAASGLMEISALTRLVPGSMATIIPHLVDYARDPSATSQVKQMLEAHPDLESALLIELAGSAADSSLVMSLWSGRKVEGTRAWQARLLNQLVEAGRYQDARTAWAKFTNISADQRRLLDSEFKVTSLPPFGWTLASGGSGIAEPQSGRLHVIYYGRDDLVLASQLLTLPPGSYRLSMNLDPVSPAARVLTWTVRCLPSSDVLARIPADRRGAVAATFTVRPGNCLAQRLELSGNAPEFPQQSELTVSNLQLQRDGG